MSFLQAIIDELRDKRLLALAAATLAAALVAVPLLLSTGSKATPVAQTPAGAQPPAPTGLPVVSTAPASTGSRLTGRGRDPFAQLVHGNIGTTGLSTTGAVTGTNSPTSGGTSTTPSSGVSPATNTSTTTA